MQSLSGCGGCTFRPISPSIPHAKLPALLVHGAGSKPSPDKTMQCIWERNTDILVPASSRVSVV